ncbi:hypothetical protein [Paracoccus ravus]|uniref:hypothetical protein n=1 Tax=Paracoccus ravus TaxID=2447760 RepID=UPI00106DEC52|nr:hypothetical protein [Paracoccus ravus]
MDRLPYAIPLDPASASEDARFSAYRGIEAAYTESRDDLDWSLEMSHDPMKIPGHSGPRPTY